jgi:protein SCO1/2
MSPAINPRQRAVCTGQRLAGAAWSLLLACLMLCCGQAGAQALRLPPQPAARFAPEPGARLPLDIMLRDERGTLIRLGSVFGGAPVVLVPGYFTCPNLCGTLFAGVLQSLAMSGLEAGAYRLVGVSIDPRDNAANAADAASRRAAFASLLPGGGDFSMLTGDAPALARLEQALGYRAVRDPASGELAHAAGFVVADTEGRVTRYFPGVNFSPAVLRAAVLSARVPGAGAAGWGQRLLMLCTHSDPLAGKYSHAAMTALRGGLLLAALGLAAWLWLRRPARGRP